MSGFSWAASLQNLERNLGLLTAIDPMERLCEWLEEKAFDAKYAVRPAAMDGMPKTDTSSLVGAAVFLLSAAQGVRAVGVRLASG